MTGVDVAAMPGFRRRFLVTAGEGRVTAALEDDYHCMAVTLRHDGERVTQAEPVMDRAPWTTCPSAGEVLRTTFGGMRLREVAARGFKQANCTHLYDLAVLAAAHADARQPVRYDVLVSDPVDGLVTAEIRLNGATIHRLVHRDDVIQSPPELAGWSLFKLRGWIESLDVETREAARILQWGTIMGHGRAIPLVQQSDASRMPPNCFTFQPENKHKARRVGRIEDFSAGPREPLSHFDGQGFAGERA